MFFFLSKVLDILLSPYTWGVALLVLAVPWRRPGVSASWKRQRARGALGLAVLVVFSLEHVSNRLAYHLEHEVTSTYRPTETYDAVVLLGGVGDERVSFETKEPAFNDSVERLIATHRLLRDGRARVAIVSGGPEDAALREWSEARMLAGQLVAWGIDPSRVILEEQARNTRENAVYSERIAKERGFEKVLIVTSAFHMRRAQACFAAVGMKVDTLAVDFRAHVPGGDSWLPRAMYLSQSVKMIREIAGFWIYRAT